MSACLAHAHRYLGKGAARELFEGPCALELGHDGEHLPAALAYKQSYDTAFNAGVTTALESVKINLHDRLKMTEEFDTELLGHVLDQIATEVRRT